MNKVSKLYEDLLTEYGDPKVYWPQWCSDVKTIHEREKILIGMVLCQRTSWHNANIALKNLKAAGILSVASLASQPDLNLVTDLIRPAGFYQTKPQRLFELCTFIQRNGGVNNLMKLDLETVRSRLLEIKGIGKESCDTIMLYALDFPIFIIDEYTYRFSELHNLSLPRDYEVQQLFFMDNLRQELKVYRNMHTLIIVSQRGRDKSVMEIV